MRWPTTPKGPEMEGGTSGCKRLWCVYMCLISLYYRDLHSTVSSWLVPRFAIVARNVQIIQKPWFEEKPWFEVPVHYCGKKFWQTMFFKYCLTHAEAHLLFSQSFVWVQAVQAFPQLVKARDHERFQFTLVGFFPGFTIAANVSRADPGSKRRTYSLSLFLSFSFAIFSLSLSLYLSDLSICSFSFSLSFSSLSVITPFLNEHFGVQRITESTCWTPLTRSATSTTSTTSTLGKKKYYSRFELKTSFKSRIVSYLGNSF